MIADNRSLDHSNPTNGSNEFRILPQVEVLQPEDEETKLDELGFYPSKEKAVKSKDEALLFKTVV